MASWRRSVSKNGLDSPAGLNTALHLLEEKAEEKWSVLSELAVVLIMMKSNPHYEPPSDKAVDEFARAVCQQYAQQRNEPKIDSPEVRNGFAAFLKVLLRIEANLRNQSSA